MAPFGKSHHRRITVPMPHWREGMGHLQLGAENPEPLDLLKDQVWGVSVLTTPL